MAGTGPVGRIELCWSCWEQLSRAFAVHLELMRAKLEARRRYDERAAEIARKHPRSSREFADKMTEAARLYVEDMKAAAREGDERAKKTLRGMGETFEATGETARGTTTRGTDEATT